MESEYYNNYIGPDIIKATLNQDNILEQIIKIYGDTKNWNGRLWKVKDIFNNECIDKEFYFEFESDNGQKHWTRGKIANMDDIINPPLFTPLNQNPIYWENIGREV